MTRLILIRHGSTDDNLLYRLSGWTDTPLNEVGICQAQTVAEYLKQQIFAGNPVHAIYASPLQRTAKTAEIIANQIKLPVQYQANLKEMNFGKFDGQSIFQLYETHKSMIDMSLNPGNDEFGWEDGETRPQLYKRVHTALSMIVADHPDQTIAVVTHGGAIAYFLTGITGNPLSHWNQYYVTNCSLTTVLYNNQRFQLETQNQMDHLPEEKFESIIRQAKIRLGISE